MTLSPNVKRGPPPSAAADRRESVRKSRNSPWGGTNRTTVPSDLQTPRNRASAAEQKRSSRYATDKRETKTKDPMRALKMQRALANVSYEQRGRTKEDIMEKDRFEQFELLPIIQQSISSHALGGREVYSPTPIQRLAIPALLGMDEGKRKRTKRISELGKQEMQQFLLAAETGSGKTLAYLLPLIDAIKRTETAESARDAIDAAREEQQRQNREKRRMFEIEPPPTNEPDPSTARPRAIILLPTAELVDQVGRLVKSLAHAVKYRSALISSSYTSKVIRSRLFTTGGIDIVVSTPHILAGITESDPNILARVSHLVIDEADSLLDRSFSPTTSMIVDRATPSLQQLVLCSATIPRSLDSYLHKRFPNITRLATPNLHAIPRRVQLSVVDIDKAPYQGNRDLACAQVIYDIGKELSDQPNEPREKKIVVFVNEREKSTELAKYLTTKGIDATALSRDTDDRNKSSILANFTGSSVANPSDSLHNPRSQSNYGHTIHRGDLPHYPNSARQTLPNTKVLVMTDLGSRGIDTLLVRHVILYDVPHTSIDFIHRLGRVGRMNRRGRGVVLVGRNDRKDVVREVRDGMFRGAALI